MRCVIATVPDPPAYLGPSESQRMTLSGEARPPIPRWVWAFAALALVLRLLFVWHHARLGYQLRYDPSMYLALAENLRYGAYSMFHPRDIPDTLKMPGYPALLYALGGNVTAVLLLQALLSSVKVPLVYLLARAAGVRTALAVAAAALMALEPIDVVLAGSVLTESLFTVLLLGGTLALARGGGWGPLLGAAALFAAAAWVRPNGLVLIGAAALALYAMGRWNVWRPVVFLVVSFALVAPWSVRNARVTGSFRPSDNGPVTAAYFHVPEVLAAANDPRAAGWRAELGRRAAATDWEDRVAFRAYFDGLRKDVRAVFLDHPFTWARVHALKSAKVLVAPGRGHVHMYFGGVPVIGRGVLAWSALFPLLLVAALVYWLWRFRRMPPALRMALFIAASVLVTSGIGMVDARFKNPAMPLLLVGLAWAVEGMMGRFRTSGIRT